MGFFDKLRGTFSGGKREEIDEELAFHLEESTRASIAAGLTPEEARHEARRKFGAVGRLREETRDASVFDSLESLGRDVRFAVRGLARRPGLAATVIASLGLGIGATTIVFSVFDGMFLRPMPFAEPERLVVIEERRNGERQGANPARLRDYREQLKGVEGVTGVYGEGMVLSGRGDARRLTALRFFGDALGLLGVRPQAGRGFTREEAFARAALPAMLTDAAWRKHFSADRKILGQVLELDRRAYTVIGILPADFDYPDGADLWIPAAGDFQEGGRAGSWFQMVARTRVPLAALDAELAAVTARLRAAYPATDGGITARAVPLQEYETAAARPVGVLLLGAVGFVLLIACLNIAMLLLARAAERRRESAIRLALGAGAGALARLALLESVGLALAGGLVGVALAALGLEAFKQLLPVDAPRLSAVALDGRVLGFALALTLACGLLCGLRPALEGARLPLAGVLQAGGRSTGGRDRFRARGALVVAQVLLSMLLLTGAALLMRGLLGLLERPLGVTMDRVLTVQVPLSWEMPFERVRAFHHRALPLLAALPGVRSVGLADRLPAHGGTQNGALVVRGRDFDPATQPKDIGRRAVNPGYFQALGIPLRRGRLFNEPRDEKSPREAVINEELARRLFPAQDPVGEWISFDVKEPRRWMRITGVVARVQRDVREPAAPAEVYVSHRELFWALPAYVIAVSGDPAALAPAVRRVFRQVDPHLPLGDVLPLAESVARQTRDPRVLTGLMAAFALAALALASIGLYGLLARDVAERTQEIGVRLALGAAPGDVLALTLKRGAALAGAGLLLGAAGSVPLARGLAAELPGFIQLDPLAFALAAGVLLAVALAASYWPARRASRVDPLVALRHD